MATVTPPPRSLVEPSAPRLAPNFAGIEPEQRRQSKRLKLNRTPSPGRKDQSSQTDKRSSRSRQARRSLSPLSSPISPDLSLSKRKPKQDGQKVNQNTTILGALQGEGLPTPIKTPAKKDTKRAVKPASRALFSNQSGSYVDDTMPKRNRVSTYSPGSASQIQIYTDTNARKPELDNSEENVFYDQPYRRSSRAQTRSKAMEITETKREKLGQNHKGKEGMWYSFRGAKIFRNYETDAQDEPEPSDTTGDPLEELLQNPVRDTIVREATPPPRFMKTAYKPRTLFPDAHKRGDTTDEEAVTDIEHPEKHGNLFVAKEAEKLILTPAKQRFYATPPTTIRTTRSGARHPAENGILAMDELSTSLFTVKKGGRKDSFDDWNGRQGDNNNSQEKKRKADEGLSTDKIKRAKSDVAN